MENKDPNFPRRVVAVSASGSSTFSVPVSKTREQESKREVCGVFDYKLLSGNNKQAISNSLSKFLAHVRKLIAQRDQQKCQEYSKMVAETDGVGWIVEVMKKYPQNTQILCHSSTALGFIATFSDLGASLAHLRGAIPLILNAMASFGSCSDLQESGCICLYRLISNNEERAKTAVKVGGLGIIISAIRSSPKDKSVQLYGIAAILCIAKVNELRPLVLKSGGLTTAAFIYEGTFDDDSRQDIHETASQTLKVLMGNN
jgi:hypothetical protein